MGVGYGKSASAGGHTHPYTDQPGAGCNQASGGRSSGRVRVCASALSGVCVSWRGAVDPVVSSRVGACRAGVRAGMWMGWGGGRSG
jgi:hypothetical protein